MRHSLSSGQAGPPLLGEATLCPPPNLFPSCIPAQHSPSPLLQVINLFQCPFLQEALLAAAHWIFATLPCHLVVPDRIPSVMFVLVTEVVSVGEGLSLPPTRRTRLWAHGRPWAFCRGLRLGPSWPWPRASVGTLWRCTLNAASRATPALRMAGFAPWALIGHDAVVGVERGAETRPRVKGHQPGQRRGRER